MREKKEEPHCMRSMRMKRTTSDMIGEISMSSPSKTPPIAAARRARAVRAGEGSP